MSILIILKNHDSGQKKHYLCSRVKVQKYEIICIPIDTSIFDGFFDTKFEKEARLLFQRLGNREVVYSGVVINAGRVERLFEANKHVSHFLHTHPNADLFDIRDNECIK